MVQLLRRLNPSGIHVWEHLLAMLWRLSDQFSCIYIASRWTGPTWQDISIAGQIPTRESPWSHGWVCPKVMDSEIQLWFLPEGTISNKLFGGIPYPLRYPHVLLQRKKIVVEVREDFWSTQCFGAWTQMLGTRKNVWFGVACLLKTCEFASNKWENSLILWLLTWLNFN